MLGVIQDGVLVAEQFMVERMSFSRMYTRITRLHGALALGAVCCLGFFCCSARAQEAAFTPEQIDYFETHVRPVLAERCFECHGAEKSKGGLRLDSRQAMLNGGESGAGFAPGNPDASRIVQAIRYTGGTTMPPDAKLDDQAIAAITEWVRMGAPWPEGDAAATVAAGDSQADLLARSRAEHWAFQPVADPATPVEASVAANEVDRFVLAKLGERGLALSPEESRAALLRRLSYDLSGLPPTIEELQAFESDTAPDAYEKRVDALLASPRFGERWGRYWLDLARYADTRGYVFQQERDFAFSHTYRDYVIRAFNEDLPYDQFVMHQLAADKMELGDKRNLAGMGLLTLGRNFVGNVHDQVDDRIDVVTRGMLGLTVSCARCHDHKYDPIPIEDYYSLYGVFRSSFEPGELPLLEEPNPEDPEYQAYLAEVNQKQAEADKALTDVQIAMLNESREKAADYVFAGMAVRGVDDETLRTVARDRGLLWQVVEKWRDYLNTRDAVEGVDAVFEPLFQLAPLPDEGFAEAAQAWHGDPANRASLNPLLAAAFETAPAGKDAVLAAYRGLFERADREWQRLLAAQSQIAYQGGGAPGLPEALPDASLEAFRVLLYLPDSPANVPRGNVENYSDVGTQQRLQGMRNARARVENTHPARPDRAMVMQDADAPFDPYVFLRGKAENQGPAVPRQVPALLAQGERTPFADSGRLELAKTIADARNPLTARVMVNRMWLNLFGQGLVNTPSDFGLRSEAPTHPELLDYLAYRFANDGWSMKRLVRHLVTSQTYRQSSDWNDAAGAVDPINTLYWRQNRRRLDFEAMRDSLLAASQELDLTMGGPSVEIAAPPFSTRRTVYGRIERQNLPAVFRTFDFASPDTHAPQRFNTSVPQQALYMMNSPFVVDRARGLAALEPVKTAATRESQIVQLYRHALKREPAEQEIVMSAEFMEQDAAFAPAAPPWQYGYGTFDAAFGMVSGFAPLPGFAEERYMGADGAIPDSKIGWTTLTPEGGHPGKGPEHSTVVRWIAPEDGSIRVRGELTHENENGDGVMGCFVKEGLPPYWQQQVKNDKGRFRERDISVAKGEVLDFVVFSGNDEEFDSYGFKCKIVLEKADGTEQEFDYAADFTAPPPPGIGPTERLAQTLLMSNEFMFID